MKKEILVGGAVIGGLLIMSSKGKTSDDGWSGGAGGSPYTEDAPEDYKKNVSEVADPQYTFQFPDIPKQETNQRIDDFFKKSYGQDRIYETPQGYGSHGQALKKSDSPTIGDRKFGDKPDYGEMQSMFKIKTVEEPIKKSSYQSHSSKKYTPSFSKSGGPHKISDKYKNLQMSSVVKKKVDVKDNKKAFKSVYNPGKKSSWF